MPKFNAASSHIWCSMESSVAVLLPLAAPVLVGLSIQGASSSVENSSDAGGPLLPSLLPERDDMDDCVGNDFPLVNASRSSGVSNGNEMCSPQLISNSVEYARSLKASTLVSSPKEHKIIGSINKMKDRTGDTYHILWVVEMEDSGEIFPSWRLVGRQHDSKRSADEDLRRIREDEGKVVSGSGRLLTASTKGTVHLFESLVRQKSKMLNENLERAQPWLGKTFEVDLPGHKRIFYTGMIAYHNRSLKFRWNRQLDLMKPALLLQEIKQNGFAKEDGLQMYTSVEHAVGNHTSMRRGNTPDANVQKFTPRTSRRNPTSAYSNASSTLSTRSDTSTQSSSRYRTSMESKSQQRTPASGNTTFHLSRRTRERIAAYRSEQSGSAPQRPARRESTDRTGRSVSSTRLPKHRSSKLKRHPSNTSLNSVCSVSTLGSVGSDMSDMEDTAELSPNSSTSSTSVVRMKDDFENHRRGSVSSEREQETSDASTSDTMDCLSRIEQLVKAGSLPSFRSRRPHRRDSSRDRRNVSPSVSEPAPRLSRVPSTSRKFKENMSALSAMYKSDQLS